MTAVHRPLFVLTILVGSFLLFLVQPMVARMALPRLGGAPNVWNSAMVLYQALLLAGYAYAHRLSRQPFRRQAKLHLVLFLAAAITLPVALVGLPSSPPGWEVLWVPALLALTIGPVFFLVSAQAPLMQRWFSLHPGSGEPWALYAASNLGSFAGLLAYPLLAEPLLGLRAQSIAWSIGYVVLVLLVVLTARSRWNVGPAPHAHEEDRHPEERIGWRRKGLWLALSAVPSGLMLSTTTHLTTDIFAMPLLWVIPLGLYLLSFVFAFADNRVAAWSICLAAPSVVLLAGGLAMVSRTDGGLLLALASVALLFFVSVSLHTRLYDSRPHSARLTTFYLAMSAGGALGGAFTAIVAPVVFDWVWEHPLLVLAAAMLMPLPEIFGWRRMPGLEPAMARMAAVAIVAVILFFCWLLGTLSTEDEVGSVRVFLTFMAGAFGLLIVAWRWLFVGVLLAIMLAQGGITTIEGTVDGVRTRSYFGIYTVRDYPDSKMRTLAHGTTLHGQQSTAPEFACAPTTYYGPGSGVGIALREVPRLFGRNASIGVVGLGTGTLAAYARPQDRWTFFEIDPAVLEFSRSGTFTYVEKCAPQSRIVLGDARLEIEEMRKGSFDILAVDAFSSDAIPLHLLTEEAVGAYMDALSPGGILIIHISNRYIELEPVIAAIARERDLHAAVRDDFPPEDSLLSASSWVAVTRFPERLAELEQGEGEPAWSELDPPAETAWTDEYASIIPQIRWHYLLGNP
ncbi:hypothetical protein GCM10011371_15550 [Novosphingobium marinum]|uniref:SAM-dependent methyltransferase n=1 Tax=Novosphingobium marinum TaxID=1514948 RepID=A0A7Y9XYZ1_9SPHN|nr:fused MFS/spermidine synthase [Novosphingobium marinum]NYH95668.1 SAM-dependent methyltransferase [Novosphingobium marinum]GGC28895.1 hypothetical protein GCM10011371_15550 [Novosphingobium marinum]